MTEYSPPMPHNRRNRVQRFEDRLSRRFDQHAYCLRRDRTETRSRAIQALIKLQEARGQKGETDV